MRYAKDFDPDTPVIENCKYMQALSKIQELDGALDAVKKWDIEQAMNHGIGVRSTLPEALRKQIQTALSA